MPMCDSSHKANGVDFNTLQIVNCWEAFNLAFGVHDNLGGKGKENTSWRQTKLYLFLF